MVINVNPTTKSNLVAVAVACAKKRLEMRLVPALGGLQTLELYDMGCSRNEGSGRKKRGVRPEWH